MDYASITEKYGLFINDCRICVPEGADLSALCDDFAMMIGEQVVVVASAPYDYVVIASTMEDGWNEDGIDE